MKKIFLTYILLFGAFFPAFNQLSAQTPAGSQILNQGYVRYTYKSYPVDTVKTNTVAFTVLDAPNFELRFGTMETIAFSRETVLVRLVYKNVGNKIADTASVEATLPFSGMRFVNGSTKGTINGNVVRWNIFNVGVGKEDSVAVKAIIDSTVAVNSVLQVSSSIQWQSHQQSALLNITVNNFARLAFKITSADTIVGSGRTVTYRYTITNTGNIAASNVFLNDTLSATGTFVSSSLTPQTISQNKHIIAWNVLSIAGLSQTTFSVVVRALPNLSFSNLVNNGTVSATNVSAPVSDNNIVKIVPVIPKTISISSAFGFIFGEANKDSTLLTAVVKDSLAQNIPDGVPVAFTTTLGTFSNGTKTILVTTENGKASTYLRSSSIQNEKETASIVATAGVSQLGTVTDSTKVVLYPGAVTGIVVSGTEHIPFNGAIAVVKNSSQQLVGSDTTGLDGKFFIALNKTVTMYTLEIFVVDKFGDTIVARSEIDPDKFPRPALLIPNVISGRILYQSNGQPIPAEGVRLFLDSVSQSSGTPFQRKLLSSSPNYYRIQEQVTDADGKFKFENLVTATYRISVDSAQFPSYAGVALIPETIDGSFIINLSIDIKPDSIVTFTLKGANNAFAGDSLRYTVNLANDGNLVQYNVTVTDTLPRFVQYLDYNKGSAKTFTYDSLSGIAQWKWDSLALGQKDSVALLSVLTRNIPDSTIIQNKAYLKSTNVNTTVQATHSTFIRSLPNIQFGMYFAGGDSVVAGDSIQTKIWYANTGTDSLRGVKIIDSLYSSGTTRITLGKRVQDSISIVDSVFVLELSAIPPGASDTVTLTLITDFTLRPGDRILSSARLMRNDSTIAQSARTLSFIGAPDLSTYISVTKTANKKVAEIGDIVTYQVTVTNLSPSFFHTIGIYDILPHSFTYIKKSARFNNLPVEPSSGTTSGILKWNIPDTLQKTKSATLVYQLAVGADALESNGINRAYASAVAGAGSLVISNPVEWQITVRPGVFTEKGLIIGKVFYDDDRNTFQSTGENGIKDVELWMEDGTRIVTGDDGKFSLPEVKPGQHVIRVNEMTLPKGTSLLGGLTDFAKDPVSRFVRVTEGGIQKANFFVKRSLADSMKMALAKAIQTKSRRAAVPKYVYKNDTLRVVVDTVTMQVAFTYSGKNYLQRIEITDNLPKQFTIVPNSAVFNGRKVNHENDGDNVIWKLGRGGKEFTGKLQYKVFVNSFPKHGTRLRSSSIISLMTSDSIVVATKKLITENIVQDTVRNSRAVSIIDQQSVFPTDIATLSDSLQVIEGNEIQFVSKIFVDPKKNAKVVLFIDTVKSYLIFDQNSFMVNGIPIQRKYLAINTRSQKISALKADDNIFLDDYIQISTIDLSELLQSGENTISYTAIVRSGLPDVVTSEVSSVKVVDEFDDTVSNVSNVLKIAYRKNLQQQLPDIPEFSEPKRPSRRVGPYFEVAMKILGDSSVRQSSFSDSTHFVRFEKNSDSLEHLTMDFLKDLVIALELHPEVSIQINGFADTKKNSKQKNLQISLQRAAKIKEYLLEQGIDLKRIYFRGLGYKELKAAKNTELFDNTNKQIEFIIR